MSRSHLAALALLVCACKPDPAADPTDDTDPVDDTDESDSPDDTDAPDACATPAAPPATVPAASFTGAGVTSVDLGVAVVRCLLTEDLDLDGQIDVAWIPDEEPVLHVRWSGMRDGATTETFPLPSPAGRSWGGCAVIDQGDDGQMDLLHAHSDGLTVLRFAGRAPTVDDLVLTSGDTPWQAPAVLPIDADGVPPVDLLLTSIGGLGDGCEWDIAGAPFDASIFTPGQLFCAIAAPDGTFSLDDGTVCPNGLRDLPGPVAHEVITRDLTGDGHLDLLALVEFGPLVLAPGRPGGGFDAPAPLPGLEDFPGAFGGEAVDLDADGRLDLLLGLVDGWVGLTATSCLTFDGAAPASAGSQFVWSPRAADLDRNGALDVVGASAAAWTAGATTLPPCEAASWLVGEGPLLTVSLADGAGWSTVGLGVGPEGPSPFLDGRVALADLDGDGALEIAVASPKGAHLYDLDIAPAGAWLRVRPLSAAGAPISEPTTVTLTGPDWTASATLDAVITSERTADFGLGAATGPVEVTVTWADGATTTVPAVTLGQTLLVAHPDTP